MKCIDWTDYISDTDNRLNELTRGIADNVNRGNGPLCSILDTPQYTNHFSGSCVNGVRDAYKHFGDSVLRDIIGCRRIIHQFDDTGDLFRVIMSDPSDEEWCVVLNITHYGDMEYHKQKQLHVIHDASLYQLGGRDVLRHYTSYVKYRKDTPELVPYRLGLMDPYFNTVILPLNGTTYIGYNSISRGQ